MCIVKSVDKDESCRGVLKTQDSRRQCVMSGVSSVQCQAAGQARPVLSWPVLSLYQLGLILSWQWRLVQAG